MTAGHPEGANLSFASVDKTWVGRVSIAASVLTLFAVAVVAIEMSALWLSGRPLISEYVSVLASPLQPATALLILFLAVGMRFLLLRRSARTPFQHRLAIVLVLVVVAGAAVYLFAYAINQAPDLPRLLRPGWDATDPFTGIPSSNTCFVLIVLGLGTLCLERRQAGFVVVGQVLATVAAALAGMMLVEFMYGAPRLDSFPLNKGGMAVTTAACILALGIAANLSRWDVGLASALVGTGPGGMFTRASLPFLVLLPVVVLGFVSGLGYLDRPKVFGMLAVVISIGALILVGALARSLDRRDRLRAVALDRALRASAALSQNAPVVSALERRLATIDEAAPDGLQFVTRSQSETGVLGGDAHAAIDLGGHKWGLVLVDVAGHGADPALAGLRLKDAIVHGLRGGASPGSALERLGPLLTETDQMATAVVAEVDVDTGRVRCVVAGHPPPLVIERDAVRALEATGPLLHASIGGAWEHHELELARDDTLLLYTDGLDELETEPDAGKLHSSVVKLAEELRSATSLEQMVEWSLDPGRGRRFRDDVTLLIARRPVAERITPEPSRDDHQRPPPTHWTRSVLEPR